jgi:hypothetical protein
MRRPHTRPNCLLYASRHSVPHRPLACLPACLVPARLPVCPPALLLPSSCTAAILSTGSTSGVSNLVLPIFCCCCSAILDTRHAATPCSLPSQPCCLTGLDNSRATCDADTPCAALRCPALPWLRWLPSLLRSRHGTWACQLVKFRARRSQRGVEEPWDCAGLAHDQGDRPGTGQPPTLFQRLLLNAPHA